MLFHRRKAREFPALFEAPADGRLHLSGVGLLAPHLTRENAAALIGTAAGRSYEQIRRLLAERFPRSEHLALVETLPSAAPSPGEHAAQHVRATFDPAVAGRESPPVSSLAPHAPQRFALHLVLDQETHDELQYARSLLGHQVPSGDLASVIGQAVKALIVRLEKRKFGVTDRPRAGRSRSSRNPRHIPAAVRQAAFERDGGRCSFVAADGHRCESRRRLEYDHIVPVGRGGESTVESLTLRCRGHNSHAADQVYGAGFMQTKREEARRKAEAKARQREMAKAQRQAEAEAREPAVKDDAQQKTEAEAHEPEGVAAEAARPAALAEGRERAEVGRRT